MGGRGQDPGPGGRTRGTGTAGRRRAGAPEVALMAASALVGLLLLELLARILAPPNPFTPLLPLRPYVRMELHVDLPGMSPVAVHSTNRWGLRGEEPPTDWEAAETLVAIGGSTTHCFYLDDRRTWPHLLGEALRGEHPRIWVGNGGLDGQTTRAHRLFVTEVLSQARPDAALFLVGANDLGLSLSAETLAFGSPFDRSWSDAYAVLARSRALQVLWLRWLAATGRVVVVTTAVHEPFAPRPFVGEELDPAADLSALVPQLPEFRENVRALVTECRRLGVRPILATQPMLFDDTEPWRRVEGAWSWIREARTHLSAATQWRLLDLYNRALLEECAALSADCVDLASEIPKDPALFYDSLHFNEAGAEAVAGVLAARFREHPEWLGGEATPPSQAPRGRSGASGRDGWGPVPSE
ncbi:SGNH/GDSL hydrolase family protein [Myxococcota bacterium]|nr:SGNH/GDSL hydrolase family protein [Myxococcota bacterium]